LLKVIPETRRIYYNKLGLGGFGVCVRVMVFSDTQQYFNYNKLIDTGTCDPLVVCLYNFF